MQAFERTSPASVEFRDNGIKCRTVGLVSDSTLTRDIAVADAADGAAHAERASVWSILDDVVVSVSVELGRTSMTLRDVLALRLGTVIELGRSADEPIDLMVDRRRIGGGEVVVLGESFGIQLTDVAFEVADRSRSLAERPAS